MATNIADEKLRIARELLLSSPPGQFQEMVSNLKCIFDEDPNTSQLLNRAFIQEVQTLYNSNKGRNVLSMIGDGDGNSNIHDDDEFGKRLEQSFQNHLKKIYSSKGVESNYSIQVSSSPDGDDSKRYDIVLYAERIKLPQYHAGSWVAKYNIHHKNNHSGVVIKGVVEIHAHTFENGNVQLKSKTELPPQSLEESASLVEDIMNQIQKWDEENVTFPLKDVYNNMSSDTLKKIRRIMPVTRTKFDWNVEGHSFVKTAGREVGKMGKTRVLK